MRVATANILHGRSVTDGLVQVDRLVGTLGSLNADVLGLQEVDRDQPRSHGEDLAARIASRTGAEHRFVPALIGVPGDHWHAATDSDSENGPAYGVALLSRYPVRSWHVTRLPGAPVRAPVLLPGPQRTRLRRIADEPRVLLAAVLESPVGPITVATTHLSFVPGWNVAQLLRVRRALMRLPAPRILLGDLNLPGVVPAALTGWRPLVRGRTHPAGRPRVQFDHVLASGTLPPVVATQIRTLEVSDHRAVAVDFAASVTG